MISEVLYREGLSKGLRTSDVLGRNTEQLFDMFNGKVGPEGQYPYVPVVDVRVSGSSLSAPFPQMFILPDGTGIECNETTLFYVNMSTGVRTAVTILNDTLTTGGFQYGGTIPAGGGMWHYAQFPAGWVLYNGVTMCIPATIFDTTSTEVVSTDALGFITGCNFRNRLVSGGLSKLWDSLNNAGYFTDWYSSTNTPWGDLDDSYVYWGSPRGGDLLWSLFPDMAVEGQYFRSEGEVQDAVVHVPVEVNPVTTVTCTKGNSKIVRVKFHYNGTATGTITIAGTDVTVFGDDDISLTASDQHSWYVFFLTVADTVETGDAFVFTLTVTGAIVVSDITHLTVYNSGRGKDTSLLEAYMKSGEIGYVPSPRGGDVVCCKSLHEAPIIYTENEVWALMPQAEKFGVRTLLDVGVAGRGCVAGNLSNHIFIDESGEVWMIDNVNKVTPLDYKYLFSSYVDSTHTSAIVISHDTRRNEFYIYPGDDSTFLLTRSGMTEVGQKVSSIATTGYAGVVGTVEAVSNAYRLQTDVVDLGATGIKTLRTVKVNADDPSDLSARVHHRIDKSIDHEADSDSATSGKTTAWVTLDQRGEADFFVDGIDFMIELRASTYVGVKIDSIGVDFEVRGVSKKQNARTFLKRIA